MEILFIILGLVVILLLFTVYAQHIRIKRLTRYWKAEKDTKMSLAVKHGMTMEHLVPWAQNFPGDPRTFRFIGDPIDGVIFGKEKIIFVEFKTGNSQLSERQKQIRELVRQKKIEWHEVRIN